jgi:hypothetical protein
MVGLEQFYCCNDIGVFLLGEKNIQCAMVFGYFTVPILPYFLRLDGAELASEIADYGILKTSRDFHNVSSGNVLFTLLGFAGLYLLLGILFIILVLKEINHDRKTCAFLF